MIGILLLLGFSFVPSPADDLRLDEAAAVAGVPCNQDCVWVQGSGWRCVAGAVGWGCKEHAGGHCSYNNCFSYVRINAAGAVSGLALCESEMTSLVAYADATGKSGVIEEALESGFLTPNFPLPVGAEE